MIFRSLIRTAAKLALIVILAAAFVLPSSVVLAHDGQNDGGAASWHWDWPVLAAIGLTGLLYGRGLIEVWRRAGADHGIGLHQAAAFYVGLLALLTALVSPVDALGETQLSMHMIQHLLLMLAAAPLMAYGLSKTALAYALPKPVRMTTAARQPWRSRLSAAGRTITHPGLVWALHAIAVIGWHLPLIYQAAVRNDPIHILQHLSFFLTGLLFWWVFFHKRLGFVTGGLYIFTTATYSGLIGAFLTLSNELAYPVYAGRINIWGYSALEDQQLAGVIMWVPPSIIYLTALLYTVYEGMRQREPGQPAVPRAVPTVRPDEQPPVQSEEGSG